MADRDELVRRARDSVITMHAALASESLDPERGTSAPERTTG
jgi:hypothetical protein